MQVSRRKRRKPSRFIRLYTQAHLLPDVDEDGEAAEISDDEWTKVFKRFRALPFNYYGEVFNPLIVPAEEPVVADLADDLADIWRDLKPGLQLFEAGHHSAAAWHWRFLFKIHWGHHAIGALYALHYWFAENSELSAAD